MEAWRSWEEEREQRRRARRFVEGRDSSEEVSGENGSLRGAIETAIEWAHLGGD